ncbi:MULTISPECIES: DUF4172 domain-containing protein [unclassified Lentimonas]|nr:Unannotated [Lentimonas sp. CC19]CAA6696675.1 Unannotated [Lentimonas sp. CC10]CAA7072443.1 Unannotated [Lentimonas sp. CC11]
MTWNWQQADWPNFTYDASALEALEAEFLQGSGIIIYIQELDGGLPEMAK